MVIRYPKSGDQRNAQYALPARQLVAQVTRIRENQLVRHPARPAACPEISSTVEFSTMAAGRLVGPRWA
jgi:hypothetical protein